MDTSVTILLDTAGGKLSTTIAAGTPLPVEKLLIGRPVAEAAVLMPRLFNLCRAAQSAAAHLALGLPLPEDAEALHTEVLRDHMIKLFLSWPNLLGLPPRPFPAPDTAAIAFFGPAGVFPDSPAAFDAWLAAGEGCAPLLGAIRDAFAPGEAVARLPDSTPATAMHLAPQENSTALRHPGHPVLDRIAGAQGRGPLWRATARLIDAGACLAGTLPAPRRLSDGTALTPAARGQYAVRARAEDGRVAAFARVTPTDHLLTPGGMLQASFASLPAAKVDLAPLLLDILDPCVPVTLTQVMESGTPDA
ncbi:MAG: hydrogenase expression/formation protein HupK [Rhodobacteraceae bacterium]|nr:hydrogenase expression/formation protein HupK [Paracoccaceae bacterium]